MSALEYRCTDPTITKTPISILAAVSINLLLMVVATTTSASQIVIPKNATFQGKCDSVEIILGANSTECTTCKLQLYQVGVSDPVMEYSIDCNARRHTLAYCNFSPEAEYRICLVRGDRYLFNNGILRYLKPASNRRESHPSSAKDIPGESTANHAIKYSIEGTQVLLSDSCTVRTATVYSIDGRQLMSRTTASIDLAEVKSAEASTSVYVIVYDTDCGKRAVVASHDSNGNIFLSYNE